MSDTVTVLIARCNENPTPMSAWEASFVDDIARSRGAVSPKQIVILERIASRIDHKGIAVLLADQAENLATFLRGTPPSFREREEVRYGARGSFAVVIGGRKKGDFYDHESGVGGDALGMVAHLRSYSSVDAMQWAKQWLGIEGTDFRRLPPAPAPEPPKVVLPKPTIPMAQATWREAVAASGTPVEAYLASRGLKLPSNAPLRFHPACARQDERLPAMIALMTDPVTGAPGGVHRTFLAADGRGKAAGQAKMMLGAGGIIRLVPDEDVTSGLGLAEGIETALAVMQGAGWSPVWAAGSAGGISKFPVLLGIETLTIFADADESGVGIKAARSCAAAWAAAGKEVTVHRPPYGDWADVARRAA
jgi:putative DNA primase/helicase